MNTEENKKKLIEEKRLLEDELGSLGKFDKKTGDWEATPETMYAPEADESDMADRTEDYEERSAMTDTLEKRLADVNKALEKIEKGGYGVCEICGNNIEEDRLEANPAARTCKGCMEKV